MQIYYISCRKKSLDMLTNFIKIALRNFTRQPGYAVLNILGLTLGVAATLFILLYTTEELSFDKYHEKADHIYRVSSDITEPDDAFKWAVTQFPLAPTLKNDYGEVEEYVRFIPNGRTRLQKDQNQFFEERVYLVDSTIFDVFTFEFIEGNPETALDAPNTMVLSESVAKKIFGDNSAVGQSIRTDAENPYEITGVIKDMPRNSHILADVMVSASTIPDLQNAGSWGGFGVYTYVLLKEGTNPKDFEAKLPEVVKNYVATIFDELNIKVKYALLPVTDIHLKSDFEGEPEPAGEMAFIYIFAAVGIFMLLIASINYMNLATARSARRALEVGMRKVLGSGKGKLIGQFLSESVILTIISLGLSLVLVLTLIPVFNSAFNLNLSTDLLWTPPVLLGMLGILVLVGIVGGSYPAFFLSAFQPAVVLKGTYARGGSSQLLRKSLVVVQFVLSLFMLIGTGIIYDQMNYVRTKELGFDKEQMMTFGFTSREQTEKWPVLREALLQNPNITSAATAGTSPGNGSGKTIFNIEIAEGIMEERGIDNYGIDFDFFPTLGVEIVEGRNFSKEFSTDSTLAVLVNEAMVKRMAWENPIGKKVQFGSNDTLPVARVIGVVKDFHQRSLYNPIEPLMFRPRFNNRISHVKIASNVPATIAYVEQQWEKLFPETPLEYDFVDASFLALYEADQIRARIFTLFSVIMIIVACLGLLGLASFTAEQRTKEIGIRKIMGASVSNIIVMLTQNFVFLVLIAAIPAFIAAWFFMSRWLDTFSYHTSMNYILFFVAFLVTVLITLGTTGYHAYRAAVGNPVEALRYE